VFELKPTGNSNSHKAARSPRRSTSHAPSTRSGIAPLAALATITPMSPLPVHYKFSPSHRHASLTRGLLDQPSPLSIHACPQLPYSRLFHWFANHLATSFLDPPRLCRDHAPVRLPSDHIFLANSLALTLTVLRVAWPSKIGHCLPKR